MCNFIRSSAAPQRGIALIEALISMVIIAITCAGSLYVISRVNITKTEMNLQHIAVQQMRDKLVSGVFVCDEIGGSGTVTLPAVGNLDVNCTTSADVVTVSLNGATPVVVTVKPRMVLTVDENAVFDGKIIVGGS